MTMKLAKCLYDAWYIICVQYMLMIMITISKNVAVAKHSYPEHFLIPQYTSFLKAEFCQHFPLNNQQAGIFSHLLCAQCCEGCKQKRHRGHPQRKVWGRGGWAEGSRCIMGQSRGRAAGREKEQWLGLDGKARFPPYVGQGRWLTGSKTEAVLPQRISRAEEGKDLFQKPAVHHTFSAAHCTVQEDPEIGADCSPPPETRTCYKAVRISLKKSWPTSAQVEFCLGWVKHFGRKEKMEHWYSKTKATSCFPPATLPSFIITKTRFLFGQMAIELKDYIFQLPL